MPKAYSAAFRRNINATSAQESPLILLEISHPSLGAPIRVVNDAQNLNSNGQTFVALAFDIVLPDDAEGQLPSARLRLDNAGKDLVEPLEASGGAEGATVRVMQVLRSDPDTIEWETQLDLRGVEMSNLDVNADIGYEDILNRPAIALTYRPDVAPGLF